MEHPFGALDRRQARMLLIAFPLFCALLLLVYFFYFRTDYVVLYNGLKQSDASAVVAELDAKGVSYRLRDGGATILVPAGEADAVRLAVAGSEVGTKGTSGFELFNKSDMGLTDFAQKINYQRALQGELARTIMTMDGIIEARVHLAMPERSLFRGNRSTSKAAVTIAMRNGLVAEDARVAGIQRLVAAAVPDLALADVVILDERGRVISSTPVAEDGTPPAADEEEAVRQYYRARARAAIRTVLPDLQFDVRVLALAQAQSGGPEVWQDANAQSPAGGATPAGQPQRRAFGLMISVITVNALDPTERDLVGNAVAQAVGLDRTIGDVIQFAVGPIAPPPAAAPVRNPAVAVASPDVAPLPAPADSWWSSWMTKLALALAIVGGALALRLRASSQFAEQRDAFVLRIRQQFGLGSEESNVQG